MSAITQITPWQYMRAVETQFQKLENLAQQKRKEEEGVIWAEPYCNPFLTYYHNGKVNKCCKTLYDYNFFYCEGYDQERHREDRKHPFFYLNIDLEEEYPCRTVPLLTSSNYGHRPPYDNSERFPKRHVLKHFRRNNGAAYCIHSAANGYVYDNVKYAPMKPFQWNAQYGYTYVPPRN